MKKSGGIKIKDRLVLGFIAGVAGIITKRCVMKIPRRLKMAEFDTPERAAGLVLPAWKIATPRGRIIGNIVDLTVGSFLSTVFVYLLSVTGKDHAVPKGVTYGVASWGFVYGMLGRMELSSVSIASPKTLISQTIAHATYGMTIAYLIDKFGDEGLFNGEIPLNSSTIKGVQAQAE